MTDSAPALLARWLEADASSPPPAGVEDEVVLAVQVLQPQRVPAPRLDLDALLASIGSGPLAAPGAAAVPLGEAPDATWEDELGEIDDEESAEAAAFAAAGWGKGEEALLCAAAPPAPPPPILDVDALLGSLTAGPLAAPARAALPPAAATASPQAAPAKPALRLLSGGGLKRWAPVFGVLSIAAAALLVVVPLGEQPGGSLRPTPTAGAPAAAPEAAADLPVAAGDGGGGAALPAGLPHAGLIAEAETASAADPARAAGELLRTPAPDPAQAGARDLAQDELGAQRAAPSGGALAPEKPGGDAEGAGGLGAAPNREEAASPAPPPAEPVHVADAPARARTDADDADAVPAGFGSTGSARYGQNEQLAEAQLRSTEDIVVVAKQAARKGTARPSARPAPAPPAAAAAPAGGGWAPATDAAVTEEADEAAPAPKASAPRDERSNASEKKKDEAKPAPPEGAALRAAHPELGPTWDSAARARARGDRAGLRGLLDPLLAHADPEVAAEAAIQLARDALRAGDPALALRDAEAGLARGGSSAARREQLRALRAEALTRLGDPERATPSNSGG